MVLIISIEQDLSTFDVVDWLIHQNKDYTVLFPCKHITIDELLLSNTHRRIKIVTDNLPITSLWYRRGNINIGTIPNIPIEQSQKQLLNKQLFNECENLRASTIDFLTHNLISKINDYTITHNINKIDILNNAIKVGLKIPETIVTTKKTVLMDFFLKQKGLIITKPISESVILTDNKFNYFTYTSKIESLTNLPNLFFPSLFQQMIDKYYELRIFFLKNQCYSAAIFSQHDSKTKIDFRNYNRKVPNRYVPYQLPQKIERKIIRLMKNLNVDSGSIDMIVDKNEEYYFLEINPVGQYGMISLPCNYNLDKIISQYLV